MSIPVRKKDAFGAKSLVVILRYQTKIIIAFIIPEIVEILSRLQQVLLLLLHQHQQKQHHYWVLKLDFQ